MIPKNNFSFYNYVYYYTVVRRWWNGVNCITTTLASSSLLEGTNIFMNVILVRVKLKVVDDAVSLLRNSYSAPGTCYCVPLFVSCCWPPFYITFTLSSSSSSLFITLLLIMLHYYFVLIEDDNKLTQISSEKTITT